MLIFSLTFQGDQDQSKIQCFVNALLYEHILMQGDSGIRYCL